MDRQQPTANGPEAEYLAALREGRFLYQRTADGRAVFPPRLAAPGDGADLTWAESGGQGRVHAVTEQPQKPPTPSRFIAIVDMAEGFRLLSRIETATAVAIGQPVQARIASDSEPPHVFFVLTDHADG